MANVLDHDISATLRVRDVSRSFTLARAVDTPFSVMVKKGRKPKSTLYEWPFRDRFTATDEGIGDGQDVAAGDINNNEANKTMIQGRVQKAWVGYGVGDIAQEFVEEYGGINDLLADNAVDAMALAKEKMEVMFLKNGDSRAGTGSTTATSNLTRGLTHWIRSANPGGSPDLPIPTMALTPAGNIITGKAAATDVTEDNFRAVMKSVATAARKRRFTWDVFCSPDLKEVFSNFTRSVVVDNSSAAATTVPLRSFNANQADNKITLDVTLYESDFGVLRIHPHFMLPSGVHCLIVDMEHVAARPGRPPRTFELPYNGGSHRKVIDFIYGLEVSNPQCHGKITT